MTSFGFVVPLFNEGNDFRDTFDFDAVGRIDVGRIEKDGENAYRARSHDVRADDVADMDAGFGRFARFFESHLKNRGVGFFYADDFGIDDEIQITGESGFFQEPGNAAVRV